MKLYFSIVNYCPYPNSPTCGEFWFFWTQATNKTIEIAEINSDTGLLWQILMILMTRKCFLFRIIFQVYSYFITRFNIPVY